MKLYNLKIILVEVSYNGYRTSINFIPVAIYCFYFFRKTKLDVYLMFGTLTWYGAIYSGNHNLYQFLQELIKTIVNVITMLLVFRIFIPVFIPYLKSSI